MKATIATVIVVLLTACASEASPTSSSAPAYPEPELEVEAPSTEEEAPTMEFRLTSSAFQQEQPIPSVHSCDGDNISPRLTWTNPPGEPQSFALIFDDPDAPAGTWVHWVLFNLPPEARSLPEDVQPDATLSSGAIHGSNSWNTLGYGGPCPPGGEHRYFFKLYALDRSLHLEAGATKDQVLEAMEGHILAETELMGTYSR